MRESGFWMLGNICLWNLESGKFCLWNSDSSALESRIQLKESGIPLTINMQNLIVPLTKTRVKFLESGDHGRESRIQDSLAFSYMGRMDGSLGKNWIRKIWREIFLIIKSNLRN